MAEQPTASVGMVAQEDQQIASRIKDFMSSLHEAKAEWGFFHMFMAQAVLRRPIHLALPVDGQNTSPLSRRPETVLGMMLQQREGIAWICRSFGSLWPRI